jgi:hypothetical protein
MVCELVRAEPSVVTVPLRVPLAVGEKLTLMVPSLPAVNSLGQLLASAKSPPILMPVGEEADASDSRGAGGQRCISMSKGAGKGRARSVQQQGY